MNDDGKVIIGTAIDQDGLDKGISEIRRKMAELHEKASEPYEINGVKVTGGRDFTEEEQKYYDRLEASLQKLEIQKAESLEVEKQITEEISRQNDLKEEAQRIPQTASDEERQKVQDLYDELEMALKTVKEIESQKIISDTNLEEAEALKEVIRETADEIGRLTGQKIEVKGITDVKEEVKQTKTHLNGIGTTMQNIGRKALRWAGYIIGVRSAYMGIRKVISIVQRENENLAGQIKNIGAVLSSGIANVFAPILQKVVNLVAKIMMYVDYIYYKLTNKHLFDFSKTFSSASKSAGAMAKDADKMTASFDEMNTISENNAAGGVGGGIGGEAIDNPFKDWENFKAPKWLDDIVKTLEWIKKNKDKIVIAITAIVGAFLLFKTLKFISGIIDTLTGVEKVGKTLQGVSVDFTGFFDALGMGVAAIAILGGLALVIHEVTKMIDTFAKSGVKVNDVLNLFGGILALVIGLVASLTLASQLLQDPLAMGGLVLITAALAATLFTIKETLPTILDALGDFIVKIGPTLNQTLEVIGDNIAKIIYAIGTVLPPIIKEIGTLFDKVFKGISKVIKTVGDTIVNIMNTAKNLITTVLYTILDFINQLGPAVNNLVDSMIWAATKLINFMISGIEYMVNTLVISSIRNMIQQINNIIPGEGLDIPVPNNINIPRFYPQLARGGIVNNPGPGVLMGNYIAGERGPEAVIPLDDETLDRLGLAFARHTVINANITNTMNGRVISRELQKIQNNSDFAFNR